MDSVPSKTQVDRAGKRLRAAWLVEELAGADHTHDVELINAYRKAGSTALTTTVMGVRSAAASRGINATVTQRTKRVDAVIRKLARQELRTVTRMGDLWGCRAVVPDLPTAYDLGRAVASQPSRELLEFVDYNADPRLTGYRAIHLRVRQHGYRVEVQIRTPRQHEWATFVQSIERASGVLLRDGEGPAEVQRYLQALGAVYAAEDRGAADIQREIDELRDARRAIGQYPWLWETHE